MTPPIRIRDLNDAPIHPDRDYILYWMVAHRRLSWNHALDRAIEHARDLGLPLLILEGIRLDYPWASARHHRFVLDGMREHQKVLTGSPVGYLPWVEPEMDAGKGLLAALARQAALVVTDDAPWFFFPRMQSAAAEALDVRLEAVDGNGIYPVRHTDRTFRTAASFRRHLQKTLPELLADAPQAVPELDSLRAFPGLPTEVTDRWPPAAPEMLDPEGPGLGRLALDHSVPPVPLTGGTAAAREQLDDFVQNRLPEYHEGRNDPDQESGSRLSPWLHWGHISSWEIFHRLAERDDWTPARLPQKANGARSGWWHMSPESEAFLDELITWREIGFNYAATRDDIDEYASLPDWALETLEAHAEDEREYLYDRSDFEEARTHDELWNAAQRELRSRGTIHNYLRMLWGKKILEWSASPREALQIMIELNHRWAVDGRDPNSYSGIFWTLGRYDRGWPERDVYGKVRSMSSDSTRRKVSVKDYLRRFGAPSEELELQLEGSRAATPGKDR